VCVPLTRQCQRACVKHIFIKHTISRVAAAHRYAGNVVGYMCERVMAEEMGQRQAPIVSTNKQKAGGSWHQRRNRTKKKIVFQTAEPGTKESLIYTS
jgi:hypothetical protein